jgi:hypothetical protein
MVRVSGGWSGQRDGIKNSANALFFYGGSPKNLMC